MKALLATFFKRTFWGLVGAAAGFAIAMFMFIYLDDANRLVEVRVFEAPTIQSPLALNDDGTLTMALGQHIIVNHIPLVDVHNYLAAFNGTYDYAEICEISLYYDPADHYRYTQVNQVDCIKVEPLTDSSV
jgi:hypothetical protein